MRKELRAVPVPAGTVQINTAQIPKHVGENLAQIALRAIQRDYTDPAIQEDYRRWKAARSGKEEKTDGV